MQKKERKHLKLNAFIPEFLAGIIFLVVTFFYVQENLGLTGNALTLAGSVYTFAGIWTPLLYGAAVVGSITLFLLSFASLTTKGLKISSVLMCVVLMTGFSLIILTAGASSPIGYTFSILGLIVGIIGAAVGFEPMVK